MVLAPERNQVWSRRPSEAESFETVWRSISISIRASHRVRLNGHQDIDSTVLERQDVDPTVLERQEIRSKYPEFTEEDVDAFLAFESFSQGRSDLYRMLAES